MSEFKEQWAAKKLLKQSKKKAKKQLKQQGFSEHQAREAVNRALKNMVKTENVAA